MILDILKETGALLEGHFLLSSGRHSNRYVQCAKLLQYPDKAEIVLKKVVEQLRKIDIDLIVGPAMGGVIPAYEVARQLGKPAIFTERVDNIMTLRRGFEIKEGQKIIIAEDVVTTGKSSLETERVLEELGGQVVGICCIVDRDTNELDLPIYSALKMKVESYEHEQCPMCKESIPYIKPGSRKF